MKLIKFKNISNPKDHNYNVFLKGKTAYLINLRYIVPLEFIDPRDVFIYTHENDQFIETILKEKKIYWDTLIDPTVTEFVDYKATAELNNINDKETFMRFFPERPIPLKFLKNFRTWLATALDVFTKPHEEDWKHVLHYYMRDLYDDTIKWLTLFGDGTPSKPQRKEPSCGCGKTASQNTFTCNTIQMYREGIYNTMVDRFSNVQFWAALPISFIREFKSYIDNILRSNLSVKVFDSHTSVYANCNCQDGRDENYIFFRGVLERLSGSLHYIITKDITGHINFISKALKEWSTYLYEKMQWD